MTRSLWMGKNPLPSDAPPVTGRFVTLDGESYYQIAEAQRLRPFFMTVVSAADLWLFISSTGALTAGRRQPDLALFPYATEDKIHDAAETTGSKTILQVEQAGRRWLWEPFSERQCGAYRVRRNLYKNRWGNRLLFEEINEDLGLAFRYGWTTSERFGFVREAWLSRTGPRAARVTLLDGVQNLMPCGVGTQFQLDKSNLLDAYKRSELDARTGLGLFRLSSIPIDRPEPAESLRTNVVWALGLKRTATLLCSVQLDRFRRGEPLVSESDVRGERGAYFVASTVALRPGQTLRWCLVADVDRGPADVVERQQQLRQPARLRRELRADVERGTRELRQLIASADGLQQSAWPMGDARHGANVLFNVMRGGVPADGYRIDPADLRAFVSQANAGVAERHAAFFRRLGPTDYPTVVASAAATGDARLEGLCREYLPLTFSRRHGDPSRPWNRFSIVTRRPDGRRALNYEGNWRDIFQNWEALAVSFPAFAPGMICRFVSASTADGYNPYRITRDGIDWEVVDPADPWAHIGYWGDHQLIYLLKLLELQQGRDPDVLQDFLRRDLFAYANVPYRIKPYAALLHDPKETVDFDTAAEAEVRKRVDGIGADGRLLQDRKGRVHLVNLTEKLLVAVLAKLGNFIPEAGLWLNTQRPEWNDANNALVGFGASVVTLNYLRRYLAFGLDLFAPCADTELPVAAEVVRWFAATDRALARHAFRLDGPLDDAARRQVLDELGGAAGSYRAGLYRHGFTGERRSLSGRLVREFFQRALAWVDHSLRANRRPDGLYHAYNLVRFDRPGVVPIRRLYEMLEGQVAALSSGLLDPAESVQLLQALRRSAMYRADQHSYLLYPNRALPGYLERNRIPPGAVRRSRLLRALVARGDRSLIECDVRGACHFSGALTNARDVERVLATLSASGDAALVRREGRQVLALFEELFDHESFTGRSGTFFAYEGLGSIYWHMVSKLLLAVQETFHRARAQQAPAATLAALAAAYADIRRGLGDHKSPAEYGAFPADPYSHTPAHTGARQPGLTGQVKEDVLCRFGELGVTVEGGRIRFDPALLQTSEFQSGRGTFAYITPDGEETGLQLFKDTLAFTYCQVPVVYRLAKESRLVVVLADGTCRSSDSAELDVETSRSILARDGRVCLIHVEIPQP